jgi:NAD(P)-dependent dehydrogenase (short-subunit alcohol dehydrogenase family)
MAVGCQAADWQRQRKESEPMDGTCRRLVGRVAVVTGAGSGIGRAIALRLGAEGASVTVADWAVEGGEATAKLIQSAGGRARFVACDVAEEAAVRDLMETTVASEGGIDALVSNAGIPGSNVRVDELDVAEWDQVLAVNLRGVFLCAKHAIPSMRQRGQGAIVNIASTFGMVGAHHAAAYAASKGGVIALTRQLAVDYGPDNIRVNAVCPGYVDTDMSGRRARMDPAAATAAKATREAAAALQPLGRQAETSEIAGAVAFLVSDDASFATGSILVIDGGCTAHFNLGTR